MKRQLIFFVAGLVSATIAWAADGVNYDGTKLTLNNEFTRSQCGTMKKNVMPETSGLACSRQTPGYLWAHGDENTGSDKKIVAIKPNGDLAMTVKIGSGELGNGSKYNFLTGGDITPDGKWMAIKSKKYILLWERQGSESLCVTAQRHPVQIAAYSEEEQGESLAWLDATTFYTTSDSKDDTPIYKYVRVLAPQDIESVSSETNCRKIIHNGQVLIVRGDKTYTLQGQEIK